MTWRSMCEKWRRASYFKAFEKIFFKNPCDIQTSREVQLYIKEANIMLDITEQLNVTGENRFSLPLLDRSNPYLQGHSWNSSVTAQKLT